MLVLFDHSTPAPLRNALKGHAVVEAVERGWERLGNGALLDAAEAAGFEARTCDFNKIWPAGKLLSWSSEMPSGRSCAAISTELSLL